MSLYRAGRQDEALSMLRRSSLDPIGIKADWANESKTAIFLEPVLDATGKPKRLMALRNEHWLQRMANAAALADPPHRVVFDFEMDPLNRLEETYAYYSAEKKWINLPWGNLELPRRGSAAMHEWTHFLTELSPSGKVALPVAKHARVTFRPSSEKPFRSAVLNKYYSKSFVLDEVYARIREARRSQGLAMGLMKRYEKAAVPTTANHVAKAHLSHAGTLLEEAQEFLRVSRENMASVSFRPQDFGSGASPPRQILRRIDEEEELVQKLKSKSSRLSQELDRIISTPNQVARSKAVSTESALEREIATGYQLITQAGPPFLARLGPEGEEKQLLFLPWNQEWGSLGRFTGLIRVQSQEEARAIVGRLLEAIFEWEGRKGEHVLRTTNWADPSLFGNEVLNSRFSPVKEGSRAALLRQADGPYQLTLEVNGARYANDPPAAASLLRVLFRRFGLKSGGGGAAAGL